jgi:membrane-associated phospholipid phosphatase
VFPSAALGDPVPTRPPAKKKKTTSPPKVRAADALKPRPPARPAPRGAKVKLKVKVKPVRSRKDLPAYTLKLGVDLPIIVIAGTLTGGWVLPMGTAKCAPLCDKNKLWPIDKPVAGFYDNRWNLASDIGFATVAVGAIITLFVDEGWKNGFIDFVVLLETFLVSNGLTIITSLASRRARPMLYGEKAPLKERNNHFNSLSFFSGHTASCFAITMALFNTIRRRKPKSALAWVVLGVGVAVASFVSVGRVMSGRHFPTDVIAGAAVGISVGFLVPALHAQPKARRIRPVVSGNMAGLVFAW